MAHASFHGIFPAIVTPLDDNRQVDTANLEKLLSRLVQAGVHGVYAAGSTGEGMRMTLPARKALIECLAKNLPTDRKLLVHVGAENVEDALELAEHAAKHGAHAISSLPPKGSFAEVLAFYRRLAEASSLPLIPYYFPEVAPDAFTNPENLFEICSLPNVSSIKFTDFNLFLLEQLTRRGISVFNGRDEVLVAGLLMGASGGIGSTYNLVPSLYVALYRHTQRGEWERARRLQIAANALIAVLLRYPFMAALKAALSAQGIECGVALNGQRFESKEQRDRFLGELESVLATVRSAS